MVRDQHGPPGRGHVLQADDLVAKIAPDDRQEAVDQGKEGAVLVGQPELVPGCLGSP